MPRHCLLLPVLLCAGCSQPVEGYCDADNPCADPMKVCLLPEHACEDAIAWGEFAGTQQVPPTASELGGTIKLAYHDGGAGLVYNLVLPAGAPRPRELQIHTGRAGTVGPVVMSLPLGGGGIGTLRLSEDQTVGLLAGHFYADLHTDDFPGGEARAQIWPLAAPSGAMPSALSAVPSGRQETQPNPSKAQGTATLTLDERAGQLRYDVTLSGLTSALTGLHVHRGRFGADGPHVFDLPSGPAGTERFMGTLTTAEAYQGLERLYPILVKSGVTYLNVHTADQQAGELRGQILLKDDSGAEARPFGVALSGREYEPTVPTLASGTARFVLSADQTQLSYRITHSAAEVTAIALYRGAPKMTGAKVLSLDKARAQGTVPVTMMGNDGSSLSRAELLAGGLYLSLHTRTHPNGELRGQLVP